MWLLKFHAAFSALCTLTFWGMTITFKALGIKPKVIDYDVPGGGKKKGILNTIKWNVLLQFVLFVPVMNVLAILALVVMYSDSVKEVAGKKQ